MCSGFPIEPGMTGNVTLGGGDFPEKWQNLPESQHTQSFPAPTGNPVQLSRKPSSLENGLGSEAHQVIGKGQSHYHHFWLFFKSSGYGCHDLTFQVSPLS
jgi:hypothetical protein